MMHHVRPYKLFERLEGNRDVLYRIPHHRGTESETIMSLETLLLVAAVRISGAKTILELGTCLGYNAFQLARNTKADIATVDNVVRPRVFDETKYENQILPLEANLEDITPVPFDMVFCDINYTLETITKATELAFASESTVIAWHDFGHPLLPHVKPYLESRPETLIHFEDSSLVFWFADVKLREGIIG